MTFVDFLNPKSCENFHFIPKILMTFFSYQPQIIVFLVFFSQLSTKSPLFHPLDILVTFYLVIDHKLWYLSYFSATFLHITTTSPYFTYHLLYGVFLFSFLHNFIAAKTAFHDFITAHFRTSLHILCITPR